MHSEVVILLGFYPDEISRVAFKDLCIILNTKKFKEALICNIENQKQTLQGNS